MVHAAQSSNGKSRQQQDIIVKDEDEVNVEVTPPDGGWGWAVVFASFMVHVITDGMTYSYGVFQNGFVQHFETSDSAASWVASLLVGVTYCSGPVSSFFVNKFGCRAVTIAGTLLASGCLLSSVWVDSLLMLYLTAGIGTGFGFGLIYLPAIVSVTIYFEKYRSLATGIAVCGSGLGTVVFAPFIDYLNWYYGGYKYTMLILSGILLNCIILGVMFRPLEPPKTSNECGLSLKEVPTSAAKQPLKQSDTQLQVPKDTSIRLALSQPVLGPQQFRPSKQQEAANNKQDEQRQAFCRGGVMNRSDVFLRSSIHSIRKRSESLTSSHENVVRGFRLSLRSLPINDAAARLSFDEPHHNHHPPRFVRDLKPDYDLDLDHVDQQNNIMKRMLHLSLMRDPLFIIFTVSNFCTSIGFNVPYVYIISHANSLGIANGSMLLSVIGIANTLGRVVLGYVSDKPWVNRLLVYNMCLTVCGVSTILCPFCPNFALLAVYSSVYGFAAGAYVGLTSVCLVDLVGLDRLTNAFGLVLLFQGIASFAGPPIAGALKDWSGNYDASFYLAGAMIAISGLMLFVIPPIQKRALRKAQQLGLRSADAL